MFEPGASQGEEGSCVGGGEGGYVGGLAPGRFGDGVGDERDGPLAA